MAESKVTAKRLREQSTSEECPSLTSISVYAGMLRTMYLSRLAEERLIRLYHQGNIHGGVFVGIGQEAPGRVLLIGDADGDRKAATAADALFYPINPGHENESWHRFHDEAYDRFLAGEFEGHYATMVNDEFEALLPVIPLWKREEE